MSVSALGFGLFKKLECRPQIRFVWHPGAVPDSATVHGMWLVLMHFGCIEF